MGGGVYMLYYQIGGDGRRDYLLVFVFPRGYGGHGTGREGQTKRGVKCQQSHPFYCKGLAPATIQVCEFVLIGFDVLR